MQSASQPFAIACAPPGAKAWWSVTAVLGERSKISIRFELGEAGSLFLTEPRLADYLTDAATIRRRASDIFAALLDGSLSIEIAGYYALDEVERAHEELENRHMVGKPLSKILQPRLGAGSPLFHA